MKRVLKVILILLAILLVIVLVGPFLIPVRPMAGLRPPAELARENSRFLTLPFAGTDGIEIHYRSGGEGEPAFVLLHGFASSIFTWDEVFGHFAARGRTFAYDRPPFGLSERLVGGDWEGSNPYTPDASVEHLAALLDTQGLDEVILVGNSAGGTLAMRMGLAQPNRVRGLILISPAVYVGGDTPGIVRALANTPQLRRIGPLIARSFAGSMGDSLESRAFHDLSSIPPQQRELSRLGIKVENWDRALWAYTTASQSSDLASRLDEITVPTLVITGDDDRVVPTEQSIRLAGELPQAELVVLPACGHVPQEECEIAFMSAVNEWLDTQGW